jgi:predicted RNase H-like nuclease (RuvC/YqgF family)
MKKQPKWINDLVEDDHFKADVLFGRMMRRFDALLEPFRTEILRLTLANRNLRTELRAAKRSAAKSVARDRENAKLRKHLRNAREQLREAKRELWSHAGWQSE